MLNMLSNLDNPAHVYLMAFPQLAIPPGRKKVMPSTTHRASLTLSLLLNAFIFQLFRSTLSANHLKIQALKLLRHLDTTTPFQYAVHHRATTPPLDVSGII